MNYRLKLLKLRSIKLCLLRSTGIIYQYLRDDGAAPDMENKRMKMAFQQCQRLVIVRTLLLSSFCLLAQPVVAAEIYRYVDAQGRVHFTDTPPAKSSKPIRNRRQASLGSVRIYKYVDANGVVHFSDTRSDNRFRLVYEGSLFEGDDRKLKGVGIHRRHAEYSDIIQKAAERYHVDAALIHAVIHTESAYNRFAKSPKGALGLMQFMPGTAKRYGISDRTDARESINGGARYLRDLLKLFNNNKRLALAGYNAGENAVIRYGYTIPPYRETRHYVRRVLALYDLYKSLY